MKNVLIIMASLVPSLAVAVEPITPDEQKLSLAFQRYHDALRNALESNLSAARKSKDVQRVKAYSTALRRLGNEPSKIPRLYPGRIKIGDIGQLAGGHAGPADDAGMWFRVWHVIDSSSLIIHKDKSSFTDEIPQVVYHEEFFATLTGIPTAGIVDDQLLMFPQIFSVESTTKFGGTTMFKLRATAITSVDKSLRASRSK